MVRGSSRLDIVTEGGRVFEVKAIDWSAKSYQTRGGVSSLLGRIKSQLINYKGVLKTGEELTLKVPKPASAETIRRLEEWAKGLKVSLEYQ